MSELQTCSTHVPRDNARWRRTHHDLTAARRFLHLIQTTPITWLWSRVPGHREISDFASMCRPVQPADLDQSGETTQASRPQRLTDTEEERMRLV